jgi:hypothetical protein
MPVRASRTGRIHERECRSSNELLARLLIGANHRIRGAKGRGKSSPGSQSGEALARRRLSWSRLRDIWREQPRMKLGSWTRAEVEAGAWRRACRHAHLRDSRHAEVGGRAARVESFKVQPLTSADQTCYESSWHRIQARFVQFRRRGGRSRPTAARRDVHAWAIRCVTSNSARPASPCTTRRS